MLLTTCSLHRNTEARRYRTTTSGLAVNTTALVLAGQHTYCAFGSPTGFNEW